MTNKHNRYNDVEKNLKQDFQLERLTFFSDAVFAIAITLLIIEFKVPHITNDSTFESVWKQLLDLRFNLFALLISFSLIAIYWIRHHLLFKYIHNYNKQIIIANMFVLLPIIFFPFTTAFFAESIESKTVLILALRFFLLNHILAGMAMYIFYWLALVRYKEMSFEMTTKDKIEFTSDTLFTTVVFIIVLLTTLLTDSFFLILCTAIVSIFLKKVFEVFFKKHSNKQ